VFHCFGPVIIHHRKYYTPCLSKVKDIFVLKEPTKYAKRHLSNKKQKNPRMTLKYVKGISYISRLSWVNLLIFSEIKGFNLLADFVLSAIQDSFYIGFVTNNEKH